MPDMQETVPWLLDLLLEEYHKQPNSMAHPVLDDFAAFSRDYLADHRVGQTWAADANVGITLTNQRQCTLCPGLNDVAGTMQQSHEVPVTTRNRASQGRRQLHDDSQPIQ